MARFNFDPVPDVMPSGAPQSYQRISASPEMFGAAEGRGLAALGQGVTSATEQGIAAATATQHLQNEVHGTEVNTWANDRITDEHEKFLRLQGRAAMDALPAYKQKIKEIGDQALSQVPSLSEQAQVSRSLAYQTNMYYKLGTSHAGTQFRQWANKTAADESASFATTASIAAMGGDMEGMETSLNASDNGVRKQFEQQGFDVDATNQEVAKNRGKNLKNIIEQIADGDGSNNDGPIAAKKMFEKYQNQMDAPSQLAVKSKLRTVLTKAVGEENRDALIPALGPRSDIDGLPGSFANAVKQMEGWAPKAKWDVKQFSNGYGTKAAFPGEEIDPATAEVRFRKAFGDALKTVDSVNPNLKDSDPGARAALASLTYNTGEKWASSGLGEAVRAGNMAEAKRIFVQYSNVEGQPNAAIAARRQKEAAWFGTSEVSPAQLASMIDRNKIQLQAIDLTAAKPGVQDATLAAIERRLSVFHSALAQDQAAFKTQIQSSTTEALTTGNVVNPIAQSEFINRLGTEEGTKAHQEYLTNVQFGQDQVAAAAMTPEEVQNLRRSYLPQPGVNYAQDFKRQQMMEEALERNRQEKKADPAAFLLNRTDTGRNAYKVFSDTMANAQASAEEKKAAANTFANLMLSEQRRIGVAPGDERILPANYMDSIKQAVNAPDAAGGPSKVAGAIQGMAQLWGDHWPAVYRQLAKEPGQYGSLVRVIGAGVRPDAATALVQSFQAKPGDILKNDETPTETTKEITTAVDAELGPFYRSLAGTQSDQTKTDFRTMATRLASVYTQNNLGAKTEDAGLFGGGLKDSVANSAKQAVNDLVNFKYEFKDGFRVPRDAGVTGDVVQAGAIEARRLLGDTGALNGALSVASKKDLAGRGVGEDYLASETAEGLRRNGVWMTDPGEPGKRKAEGGLILVQQNGKAAIGPDGTPITLTWQQLGELGNARGARTRASMSEEKYAGGLQ